MGCTAGRDEQRSGRPDYAGYERAKRELREDLSPREYQKAVRKLAERYGV